MARWDEILTLPVQNPPTLEFSAADIVWSRVEGWRETMDRLALIPFTRVNDFVRGESNNKECPTKFHVEARRRRPPEMACKPKVDGILEYILYWCSFGPDDHRKGGVVRPSRSYAAKRKTPAGRPNTKRGCVCHFIVKRLIAEPSVALIIYNKDKHVDKNGLPCHGPQDRKAAGTQAMFAPYISDELRLQVMSLLYVGVPVETIMQRHTEAVEKQGGPRNRDDLLTHRYVRRLERKIRRSTYELDCDDTVSIGMWIENHQDHVFFYEDFSESETFALGIQTEWQLQQLIRFGKDCILAADSRFGTNKLKYPVYSLLVFDSKNNAIPVAWIMTPNFASREAHRWMGALYDRVRSKDPTWKLGGFIVDDPSADVVTIREVFGCSVLISFWRVRHAWHKNLMEKCSETETRAEMSKRLGDMIASICRGSGDIDSFEAFMEDFVDCSDFLDYFKAVWYPRMGMWATALSALPVASTEVSAAIECYHTQLKLRVLNEDDSSIYQRADWLVDKLGTKVHSYYWLDEYSGKENFARYWKDEWKSGLSSWRRALQIPDSNVIMDGKCAKVLSSKDREVVHIVMNPGSEFALCDCHWSSVGNLCKHMIKTAKVYRDKGLATTSTSLLKYNQILVNILHCPPNDSVIRDHAVALAVSVQSQLNELFTVGNGSSVRSALPKQQQVYNTEPGFVATDKPDNPDEDSMNERPPVPENSIENLTNWNCSVAETNVVSGDTACSNVADGVILPAKASLPSRSSSTQPLCNNDFVISDHDVIMNVQRENEAGYDALRMADEYRDDVLADARCGEATQVGSDSQTCDPTNENHIPQTRIDSDQPFIHSSSSLSRFEVANGFAEKECAFQMSSDMEIKSSEGADGPSLGSDTFDALRVSNEICRSIEKKTLILGACSTITVEKVSLDQHRVYDNWENRGYQPHKASPPAAGADNHDDGDVRHSPLNVKHCSGDCNDNVLNPVGDPREEAGSNHKMDDALVNKNSCKDHMGKGDEGPLSSAQSLVDKVNCNAVEDSADNGQSDQSLRMRNEPTTEAPSDLMDFEMSAVPVEEVRVVENSSGTTEDSMDIAPEVPAVINGIA